MKNHNKRAEADMGHDARYVQIAGGLITGASNKQLESDGESEPEAKTGIPLAPPAPPAARRAPTVPPSPTAPPCCVDHPPRTPRPLQIGRAPQLCLASWLETPGTRSPILELEPF